MIYVVATLTIKPETRADMIAAAKACIVETRKEVGNIAYDLHESVTDPAKLVFVEQWENAEALVPHRSAEHMKTFGRVVVKCLAAPPKIEVITPANVEVR
ncbi:MAG: antibiotic biosynthesis monooxygenase [Afipia sp.]|nr:MAG: antibiotic biosynthesis monooxygenase [Afipia sp.]